MAGTTLPTRISAFEAGLARKRSHVFHCRSAKKLKPMNPTRKKANIVVMPGTVNSLPLAVGFSEVRARRATGLKNAIITRGISVRTTSDSLSAIITRSSWRTRAALRDRDIVVLRLVAAPGEGEVHRLQRGVDDLEARQRGVVGAERREDRRRGRRGIRRRHPDAVAVGDRAPRAG